MRAFQTALKPSRILNILTILLHSASIAVCLTWFYGWMMWLGLSALLASFIHSLRIANLKNRHAVTSVIIDRDGRAEIVSGKEKNSKGGDTGGRQHGDALCTDAAMGHRWQNRQPMHHAGHDGQRILPQAESLGTLAAAGKKMPKTDTPN